MMRNSNASEQSPQDIQGRDAKDRLDVGGYLLAMRHELKTPLNAVIGMSGLLLDADLDDRQRQYARSIHTAGESLGTVLNDLLDLSRIATGQLLIEPIPFDLKSMVEEAAKVMALKADERGLALRVDWRPALPRYVIGDPGRTRQVLGNLVGHAMNATSQGEIVIQVMPDGDTPAGVDHIRFVVEDTGVGLPADRLERVFSEYLPIDASPYRSFGISGLGRRISADLVRLMGGDFGAESEVGKGSRFWFRLPLPPAQVEPVVARSVGARAGHLLIVEADQASRRRLQEQVVTAGWTVDFADDLGAVEASLRAGKTSGKPFQACLLSDYAVRPSHAELAQHLKADEQLAPVALVMITAVGSPGEGKRLWHAGFAGYLRKPVPGEEIVEMLAALQNLTPSGRGPALITRHSLAEAKHAQTVAQFELIDDVLASLTAADTGQVLVFGFSAVEQARLADGFGRHDLRIASHPTLAQVLAHAESDGCEWIVVDADHPSLTAPDAIARLIERVSAMDPGRHVVAIVRDGDRRNAVRRAGLLTVLTKPIQDRELDDLFNGSGEVGSDPAIPSPEEGPHESVALLAADDLPAEAPVAEPNQIEAAEPPALVIDELSTDLEHDEPAEIELVDDLEKADFNAPNAGAIDGFVANDAAAEEVDGDPTLIEPIALADHPLAEPDDAAPDASIVPVDLTGSEDLLDLLAADPSFEDGDDLEPLALDEPVDPPHAEVTDAPVEAEATDAPVEAEATDAPVEAEADLGTETTQTKSTGIIGTHTVVLPTESGEKVEVSGTAETVSETPAPVQRDLPVVGANLLDELRTGAASFARHLVTTFLREAPQRIAEVQQSVAAGDLKRAGETARNLKTMSGLLGAAKIGAVAEELVRAVAEDDGATAGALAGELEQAFHEVRMAVEPPTEQRETPAELPAIGEALRRQLSPEADPATRSLALKLVANVRMEAPNRLADLIEAIEQQDAEAVQRIAPTLKSLSNLIGAEALAKLCALVEADARLRRVAAARRYIEPMQLEVARVQEALEAFAS